MVAEQYRPDIELVHRSQSTADPGHQKPLGVAVTLGFIRLAAGGVQAGDHRVAVPVAAGEAVVHGARHQVGPWLWWPGRGSTWDQGVGLGPGLIKVDRRRRQRSGSGEEALQRVLAPDPLVRQPDMGFALHAGLAQHDVDRAPGGARILRGRGAEHFDALDHVRRKLVQRQLRSLARPAQLLAVNQDSGGRRVQATHADFQIAIATACDLHAGQLAQRIANRIGTHLLDVLPVHDDHRPGGEEALGHRTAGPHSDRFKLPGFSARPVLGGLRRDSWRQAKHQRDDWQCRDDTPAMTAARSLGPD